MRIARKHKEIAEVSTESLNDIMFFLLLFFLIVSTFANTSVLKLNLPSSSLTAKKEIHKVVLEINADRKCIVNKSAVAFTELESALKIELGRTQSPEIILMLDKTLSVQDLADVMQIGYGLGAKMILETKSKTK